MPARRKAGQNKATAIRAKTPKPRKQRPARDSVTERRKRKSGIADSAIRAPRPKSNRTTPKQKTAHNKKGRRKDA